MINAHGVTSMGIFLFSREISNLKGYIFTDKT